MLLTFELGALTAGAASAWLGIVGAQRAKDAAGRRQGRRHALLGGMVILLVLVPNLLGAVLPAL
ncbi:hypothetical protein [Deinococcus pimensis]|uniref:hypothetical protein n=1 Tax=Deinococcus pimensis TaxID=309888 RepID=UPI0012F733EE|nr:hypothetical protein [Deinococcus pimensis]